MECPYTVGSSFTFHNGVALRDEARNFLRTHEAWLEYWAAFDAEVDDNDNPGALSIVRLYQKASVTRLPSTLMSQSRKKVSPYSKRLRTREFRPKYVEDSDESDDEESREEESQIKEHGTEVSEGVALTALTKSLHLRGLQTPNNPKRSSVVTPQTPASGASSSPAEDEAVVNTAFVLFLQGLCI